LLKRIKLETENKEGDKGCIIRGEDTVKFVNFLRLGLCVYVGRKCKTKECQNKFQRLEWKEYENEDCHVRGDMR
jgi:hypothetical protein